MASLISAGFVKATRPVERIVSFMQIMSWQVNRNFITDKSMKSKDSFPRYSFLEEGGTRKQLNPSP